jgi:O-antigen/teichoic acid export membrane protein
MVAGYLVAVVLARDLGPVRYGMYGIVYSVLVGAELIGRLGIPQAMSRLIAQRAHSERGLAGTGVSLAIAIYLPLFVLMWFGAPFLARLFNVADGAPFFRVAAIDIPFFGLYFIGSHIVNGRREFLPEAAAVGLYAAAKVVGVLVLVATTVTIEGALIVNAAASVVALGYLVVKIGLKPFVPRLTHLRPLLSLAIYVGLFSLGAQILVSLDLWALNAIGEGFPNRVKGYYVGATNLGRLANVMAFVMTAVLIPSIAKAVAKGDRDLVSRATRGAGRFLLVLLLPMAAIGMANAGEIMALVYGEPYRAGAPILAMLLISHGVLFTMFVSFSSILIGLSIEKEPAWIALGVIPLAAGLNLVLIPSLGASGAPLAAIVSTSVAATAVAWRVRIHVGEILAVATVARCAALSVFIWAVSILVRSSGPMLLVELVAASVTYLVLAFLIGLIRRSDLELLRS